MPVYLSPGVFPREIDLSVLPTGQGPLRPAFIGTAQKGPMNQAILLTNAAQAIEIFGPPFPESYFMYAVLAFLEEGGSCYGMRVGIECRLGQPEPLNDICVDTSGSRNQGWGRIPLFSGMDFGRINLRRLTPDAPYNFHPASVEEAVYNDIEISDTDGPTEATLTVAGTYTGSDSDSFVLVIIGMPDDGEAVSGATFQLVRNSDGAVSAEGVLTEGQAIDLGDGISVTPTVSQGRLDINDTFLFSVEADNRTFSVAVEGDESPAEYQMPSQSYTSLQDFVNTFNALVGAEDYLIVGQTLEDGTLVPQLRTAIEGRRIQLTGSKAFAAEVGRQQYSWDIPRSYLVGLDSGLFSITTQNNRVVVDVIGKHVTKTIQFNVPVGLNQTATGLAAAINGAGVQNGQRYFEAFPITFPDGSDHVVIAASLMAGAEDHSLDTIYMRANYTHLKTLRFAEHLEIRFPHKLSYRGYYDGRRVLPSSGEGDAAVPLSCEIDQVSDECASDTAYFQNVVGWLVAPSPGTWLRGFKVSLEVATGVVGDAAGRYNLLITDPQGVLVDRVEDISFDQRADRYIGRVVNPGSPLGGTNGNLFLHWEARPSFLQNDPRSVDPSNEYVVRQPSPFTGREFNGMADGIPLDPEYSSALDAAVIGDPSEGSGLYAFENPEAIDINLLAVPGFSSGAVIGQALQMCEQRGDVLFLVDPPFGLRPQQAVDWHNGMLLSDLRAAINSSYGALYWGWLRVYDQFSRNEIWIPPSGHVAAVFSRTARVAEQWFAPAGLRRGRLLTALDIEYSPSQGERNLLYGSGNAVNAIVKFPQEGIVVWGQRTLQRSQSALDRVNVRMLLIYIKKNLIPLLRNYIFEPNDRILWKQVQSAIEPFLADISARRGLNGFRVVIDETNNTPERIDRNELTVSIFLKPERTVEFIALNLVTLRTGASFAAEEVLAAGGVVTANNS